MVISINAVDFGLIPLNAVFTKTIFLLCSRRWFSIQNSQLVYQKKLKVHCHSSLNKLLLSHVMQSRVIVIVVIVTDLHIAYVVSYC